MNRINPRVAQTIAAYADGDIGCTPQHDASWLALAVLSMEKDHASFFVKRQHPSIAGNGTLVYSSESLKGQRTVVLCSTKRSLFRVAHHLCKRAPTWAPKIFALRTTHLNIVGDEATRKVTFATVERCTPLSITEASKLRRCIRKVHASSSRELSAALNDKDSLHSEVQAALSGLHQSGFVLTRLRSSHFARAADGRLVILGFTHWD
jgi:hypothetical protein